MSRFSYVNGSYCEHRDSFVHIEDRGYQFADGVYEVFAVINEKIVDFDGHLNRLFRSLNEISLKSPIVKEAYLFHIRNLISKNKIKDGLIYLQISRGVAQRDFKFPKNIKPSIVITAKSNSMDYYYSKFNKGIKVKTTEDLRWKRVDIKTLNLLPPVLAKQKAVENGCEEAWMIDSDGYITEGSSSNAWILIKDKLLTTPATTSILKGITRTSLINALKKENIKLIEKRFNKKDIKVANEAFITSATQFVMPVIKVDNISIGNGKVGKYAHIFKDAYMEAIQLK
jgi:D-alanine transaminase